MVALFDFSDYSDAQLDRLRIDIEGEIEERVRLSELKHLEYEIAERARKHRELGGDKDSLVQAVTSLFRRRSREPGHPPSNPRATRPGGFLMP